MKKLFVVAAMLVSFISGCSSSAPVAAEDPNNPNPNGPNVVTYTISGTITGAAAASATVTLSGAASGEAATDAGGTYSFSSLAAGDYTVTPSKDNSAFNPASLPVTLSANSTADFASATNQSVSIISSPTIDGTVNECDGGDLSTDTTGNVGKRGIVDECMDADRLYRTFFSFDLATAGIETSATIVSATLSFSQALTMTPYTGNSLTIDHVNYGDALMTDDWDTTALTSSIATNTTATAGVVTISTDLKDAVQSDVSERRRTQFRLSFPDAIAAGNYITIERGAGALNPPTLNVTYYQY